jgi:hypothetical protein
MHTVQGVWDNLLSVVMACLSVKEIRKEIRWQCSLREGFRLHTSGLKIERCAHA